MPEKKEIIQPARAAGYLKLQKKADKIIRLIWHNQTAISRNFYYITR
jgi:hypothetical protein